MGPRMGERCPAGLRWRSDFFTLITALTYLMTPVAQLQKGLTIVESPQWRIDTGHFLKGATLQQSQWKAPNDSWDHDHCACCWAKFGYTTTNEYRLGAGYHGFAESASPTSRTRCNGGLLLSGEHGDGVIHYISAVITARKLKK